MKKKSKAREAQRVGRVLRGESAIDMLLEFICHPDYDPNVEAFRQAFKDAVREVVSEQVRDAVRKTKLDELSGYDGR